MIAALAAGLAAALVLGAVAAPAVLMLSLMLVQGVVVSRWFAALQVPGGEGGVVVAGLAGLAADLLVLLRDERRPLAPVGAVLGVTLLAALLHQLLRRDGRERVTSSVGATTTLAVLVVLATGHLGAILSEGGAALAVVAALAAGVVVVLDAVPLPVPRPARSAVALVVGTSLGVAVGAAGELGAGTGALVGLGCAVTAAVATILARRTPQPEPFVSAGLPLLLAGPVAFLLGRLLIG